MQGGQGTREPAIRQAGEHARRGAGAGQQFTQQLDDHQFEQAVEHQAAPAVVAKGLGKQPVGAGGETWQLAQWTDQVIRQGAGQRVIRTTAKGQRGAHQLGRAIVRGAQLMRARTDHQHEAGLDQILPLAPCGCEAQTSAAQQVDLAGGFTVRMAAHATEGALVVAVRSEGEVVEQDGEAIHGRGTDLDDLSRCLDAGRPGVKSPCLIWFHA